MCPKNLLLLRITSVIVKPLTKSLKREITVIDHWKVRGQVKRDDMFWLEVAPMIWAI